MKEEIEKMRTEFNARLDALLKQQEQRVDPFLLRKPMKGEKFYYWVGNDSKSAGCISELSADGRWGRGEVRSTPEALLEMGKRRASERRIIAAVHEANDGWWPDFDDFNQKKFYRYVGKECAWWNWEFKGSPVPDSFLCSAEARCKLNDSLDADLRIWMGIE